MPSDILNSALEYAEQGFRVVPVDVKKKHPPIKAWHVAATTDEDKINEWFGEGAKFSDASKYGIFVVFGPSSGIIDIDLDDESHYSKLAEAFGGEIPVTCQFTSGQRNAPHFLFKFRDDLPEQANVNLRQFGIEADVKTGFGDKGSGSTFPPSGNYKWKPSLSPEECDVAELPDTFQAWLVNSLAGGVVDLSAGKARKPSVRQKFYEQESVNEGERDDSLYAEACELWREQLIIHGIACFESPKVQSTVYNRMWAWNKAKCVPPLGDDIVLQKCESARLFQMKQAGAKVGTYLTNLGLAFHEAEWYPGSWKIEMVRSDPRRVKLYAPFLPKKMIEMMAEDFDYPKRVHKAVWLSTGTVCLDSKPGFWNSVWNGSTVVGQNGKKRSVTGVKAKLIEASTWVDPPPEEQWDATMASLIYDWLAYVKTRGVIFDPMIGQYNGMRGDDVCFKFSTLQSHLSQGDIKVTRNQLSQFLHDDGHQISDRDRYREGGHDFEYFIVTPGMMARLGTLRLSKVLSPRRNGKPVSGADI